MAIDGDLERSIGERVKAARVERGMTLQALASELGLSYQQVGKYETGHNRISASTLYHVARALDVDLSYFFINLRPKRVFESDVSLLVDTDIARALSRIEDTETRLRLAALIEAIDGQNRTE